MRSSDLIARLPVLSLVAIATFSTSCKKNPPEEMPMTEIVPLLSELSNRGPVELNMAKDDGSCDPYEQEELKHPTEIRPVGSVLETALNVRIDERCVPVWSDDENDWVNEKLALRTYGYPADPNDSEIDPTDEGDWLWSAPGPTFLLTKTREGDDGTQFNGTQFSMTLHNQMPADGNSEGCNDYDDGENSDPETSGAYPNCFHGDNNTNFHFHGFHISPQGHQDNVGVLITPATGSDDTDSSDDMDSAHDMHAAHGDEWVFPGKFRYALDPIPDNQPEGTHWYHAHKHGSTALQLLNGLSGTFLIFGDFDFDIYDIYGVDFNDDAARHRFDKLMVVQQIGQELPLTDATNPVPLRPDYPLVNGQANPIVKMAPGEIQRWRMVSATMTASTQLEVNFESADPDDPKPEIVQIAKDGVQFSYEIYAAQPLLTPVEDTEGRGVDLSPGYRVDLLVKAPKETGDYFMTHELTSPSLKEDVRGDLEARNAAILKSLGLTDFEGSPLLTVRVEGDPVEGDPAFPTEENWPALPEFLDDIPEPAGATESVVYGMSLGTANTMSVFSINDEQFKTGCVEPGQTIPLETPVAWELGNDSGVAHPFHIHVNPFQVIEYRDAPGGWVEYEEPIWMDTVNIPVTFEAVFSCEDDGGDRVCEEYLDYGDCSDACEEEGAAPDCNTQCAAEWYAPYNTCVSDCASERTTCRSDCDTARDECKIECDGDEDCEAACEDERTTCRSGCDTVRDECDTECLDDAFTDGNFGECGAECEEDGTGCCEYDFAVNGRALIYQEAHDYTGSFVQHCHILGHEDRGMMLNVQTVCEDNGVEFFGTPSPGEDECATPSEYEILEACGE